MGKYTSKEHWFIAIILARVFRENSSFLPVLHNLWSFTIDELSPFRLFQKLTGQTFGDKAFFNTIIYHAGYIAFRFIRKAEKQQGCLPQLYKVIMFNPNLICGEKANNSTAVAGIREAWKGRKLHWSKPHVFYSNPHFSSSRMRRDKKQTVPAQMLVYFHDAEAKEKTETKTF